MFEFIWFIAGCMVAGLIIISIILQRSINKHLEESRKKYDDSIKDMEGLDPEYAKMIDDNFWDLTDD